jgi:hypothetical protein
VSYDLEVRSKPPFGRGVPLERVASELTGLPGVVRINTTSFGLDRLDTGVALSIDIGHQTSDDEEPSTEFPEFVNFAIFLVPYPLLDKTGPVALEMALELAEKLNWSVYDLQAERELSRESLPDALRLQKAFGQTAREVLDRAVAADLSLGELFVQEMWNHRLLSASACFVLATVGTAWLLFALECSREAFDRYMGWGVSIGGLALMWLKGLAQAIVRYRRLRRDTAAPQNSGNEDAA